MRDLPDLLPANKWLLMLGIFAIFGHLVGIAADLLSGFVAGADVSLGPITSLSLANIAPLFEAKDLTQARSGHFLAIFFIPLGILGIWQIFLMLSPQTNRGAAVFLILGTLGIVYSTFYHGTLAFIAAAIQHQAALAGTDGANLAQELLEYINSLSEPLAMVLLIANGLVSSLYAWLVLFRQTSFPRWMAAVNPITFQLTLSAMIWLLPEPLSQILWLIVFNFSMVLWFAATTIQLTMRKRQSGHRESLVKN